MVFNGPGFKTSFQFIPNIREFHLPIFFSFFENIRNYLNHFDLQLISFLAVAEPEIDYFTGKIKNIINTI
jgi:hypothetical protein